MQNVERWNNRLHSKWIQQTYPDEVQGQVQYSKKENLRGIVKTVEF